MMAPTGSLTVEEKRIQLAKDHDHRMRELEANHIATWSEMASIAIAVRDGREWELLKFGSFNQWLHDAAPQSRSHIYAGIGLLEELRQDVSKQDLKRIPQTTAKVMVLMSKRQRQSKRVLEKAKTLAPREFIADVRDSMPELHLEKFTARRFNFSKSQDKIIEAALAMANVLEVGNILAAEHREMSDEQAMEKICSDYMLSHQGEYEAIAKKG
jgi:hypothetical protein